MTGCPGADGGPAAGASTDPPVPPVALDEPTLPEALQQHADAVLVVQQRIQRLGVSREETAQLSRELRRTVQSARVDIARGTRQLDRLRRRLDALGG